MVTRQEAQIRVHHERDVTRLPSAPLQSVPQEPERFLARRQQPGWERQHQGKKTFPRRSLPGDPSQEFGEHGDVRTGPPVNGDDGLNR